jgi:hypothetical protein
MTKKKESTLSTTSSTSTNMEQGSKKRRCLMVRKITAPKVERTSIRNAQGNEPLAQSTKKYVPLPEPCMSDLIKRAKEALKKARLEKEARLLKEKIVVEEEEAKLLEEKTRKDEQMVLPQVEDFETFVKTVLAC